MPEQKHSALDAVSGYIDTRALQERLGSAEELTSISPAAHSHLLARIQNLPALREFLFHYRDHTLGPLEFRWIYQAAECASHNHWKELILLDHELSSEKSLHPLYDASHFVGLRQLNRMRLLKDIRAVQRYREAVHAGEARGWHTIVYGLVLAAYSIPLRQGLIHYGRQTLFGFIESVSRGIGMKDFSRAGLENELFLSLPPLVQKTLSTRNGTSLKLLD